MNLKPIVASIILGLSGSAFAASHTMMASQNQLDAMKTNSYKMDSMLSQNQGGTGLSSAETQNWFNNVTVGGKINLDFLASNHTSNGSGNFYQGSSTNDLQLTDAALFFDVAINEWTKAHLSTNFRQGSVNANYSTLSNYLVERPSNLPLLDEAYITLMNCSQSPLYARIGRQYATFGNYDVYAAVPSFTQLLSETNEVALVGGYLDPSSFAANIYTFRGINKTSGSNPRIQNYGATVAFGDVENMGFRVDLGYLDNMADVAYVSASSGLSSGYTNRVRALSADAMVMSGPFDGNVKYVTALNRFTYANIANGGSTTNGAEPWAAGVDVGYNFNMMAHQSRVGLGYQQSGEATNVGALKLPQKRYQAEYTMDVSKNANVGFVVYHDQDYSTSHGGTNDAHTTGVVRLGVDLV